MRIHERAPDLFGEKILDLEVPSNLDEKNPLIERILSLLEGRSLIPGEKEQMKVRLCLDEALINAIRHGNGLDPAKIVRVGLYVDTTRWGITIEDEGEGFQPSDVPDVNDPESLFLEGGRGILLMQEFMDLVWYWERGNRVLLARTSNSFQPRRGFFAWVGRILGKFRSKS